jgi:hypothetical protein
MRMIFRCDPALTDYLPRPIPARSALPDWLRAMPAKAHSEIHGRDIRTVKQCPPFIDAMARCCDPAAVRHYGRSGFVLVAMEHSRAADTGTSTGATKLSCRGAIRRSAVCQRRPGRAQVQQLLDHRTRARLVAVCHPSRQPGRSAVSPDLGTGGCRSLP